MHMRAITLEEFAGLFEGMTVHGRVDTGPIMSTTATHPDLGACVVIQDACPSAVIVHSQLPIRSDEASAKIISLFSDQSAIGSL